MHLAIGAAGSALLFPAYVSSCALPALRTDYWLRSSYGERDLNFDFVGERFSFHFVVLLYLSIGNINEHGKNTPDRPGDYRL